MITYSEYWRQIETIVKDAKKEAETYGTELTDILWEISSNHEYAIYTGKSYYVLLHSKNDDYYLNTIMDGQPISMDHTGLLYAMSAYAIYADCLDCLEQN